METGGGVRRSNAETVGKKIPKHMKEGERKERVVDVGDYSLLSTEHITKKIISVVPRVFVSSRSASAVSA